MSRDELLAQTESKIAARGAGMKSNSADGITCCYKARLIQWQTVYILKFTSQVIHFDIAIDFCIQLLPFEFCRTQAT